ncbi:MAG: protein translocase subunit SecD, partial [Clostridium sp.]
YVVALTFDEAGTKAFGDATTKGVGKPIYIVYDNQVISAPNVKEPITGGQCRIDGMKDYEEANNLASTIRIGSLSLELEELRSNVVGAKLGQEAISTSLKAGAIGFAIIIVFMIAVYLIPGVAAAIALCLYVGLILILLVAFEVTLTLPGVAGILLSIGMAVDANVIIFTRIKEEIGLGKTVKSAIKTGFAKALSAIIDGNVTTLIAAAVLFLKGSGTVKGFASTLAIGIILSMFTALFVTKFILNCLYEAGLQSPKFYGIRKEAKVIPFLKYKKIFFACSAVLILTGVVAMGYNSSSTGSMLNYSMEFKGGTSTNVTFNEDMSLERISSEVVPVVEKITGEAGTQTQKVAGGNEVIIKTRTLTVDERETLDKALADNFGVDQEKITADSISGAISAEMKQDALIAVIIATICMLIYIWFRFSNITFAASAVLALIHDVLVVITFYAVLKWSVGSTFIACMLTIVGYSINATIVIFDRIRENMKMKKHTQTIENIVDLSISQTLSRSVNT